MTDALQFLFASHPGDARPLFIVEADHERTLLDARWADHASWPRYLDAVLGEDAEPLPAEREAEERRRAIADLVSSSPFQAEGEELVFDVRVSAAEDTPDGRVQPRLRKTDGAWKVVLSSVLDIEPAEAFARIDHHRRRTDVRRAVMAEFWYGEPETVLLRELEEQAGQAIDAARREAVGALRPNTATMIAPDAPRHPSDEQVQGFVAAALIALTSGPEAVDLIADYPNETARLNVLDGCRVVAAIQDVVRLTAETAGMAAMLDEMNEEGREQIRAAAHRATVDRQEHQIVVHLQLDETDPATKLDVCIVSTPRGWRFQPMQQLLEAPGAELFEHPYEAVYAARSLRRRVESGEIKGIGDPFGMIGLELARLRALRKAREQDPDARRPQL